MTSKSISRRVALQVLFAWDAAGARDDEMAVGIAEESGAEVGVRLRAIEWARGAWEMRSELDARTERLAPQWPPRRQPAVDRNILRLAAWELTSTDTPPKVVIDEAIEMAKLYSTENSPAFVNGVLDALLREHLGLTQPEAPPAPSAEPPTEPPA
jgi:N utilization substance protein B